MCFTRFVKYCWFYELKSPHHAGLHVKASYCVSAVLSDLQIETLIYLTNLRYIRFHFFSCHND